MEPVSAGGSEESEFVGESPFNRILQWTGDHHLRRAKFIGLREDKLAKTVKRK